VEFLRERFERERQEDLNQLRLKMEAARETIDAYERLEFVGETSPLVQKARALLEQADGLLIEGDLDGSFELVRQSQATADEIQGEAEQGRKQWKELVESLITDKAPHVSVLSNPDAVKLVPDMHQELSDLAERTRSIVETKNIEALKEHYDALARLSDSIGILIKASKEGEQTRTERVIRDAIQELRLATLLKADDFCPDVVNAARAYLDLARTYLHARDFARAESAAYDAHAKASDASTLAQAASERACNLATEYMKIAAAQIEQQQFDTARASLERGLTLVHLAQPTRQKEESALSQT
jgi:tetratricopeptide (TPR) repeat protein